MSMPFLLLIPPYRSGTRHNVVFFQVLTWRRGDLLEYSTCLLSDHWQNRHQACNVSQTGAR